MKPFTSPMNKGKIGMKPSFAIRPKVGPPMQTPAKYENGGAAGNAGTDEEINTSPPEQSYGAGMPSSTPPPGPS